MVGENIKKVRKKKRLTQQDLADLLGVSRAAVCLWESGRRELKMQVLTKISKVLGVSLIDLVKGVKENNEFKKKEGEMRTKAKTKKSIKRIVKVTKPRGKKVKFELYAPEAKKVVLTGDFLSWKEDGLLMKRNKKGQWTTSINLLPGRYEYKFIVDGQWWTDPVNSNVVFNSFGTQNSVIEVN